MKKKPILLKRVAVVVPSKERPHNIERLLDAMEETCRAETIIHIGVNSEDPTVAQYRKLLRGRNFKNIKATICIAPEMQFVVPWINYLSRSIYDHYAYIGHFGDDNVPRTEGWDVEVMRALEADAPFVYCNDLDPCRGIGTHPCHIFTHSKLPKALGYFAVPSLKHGYCDLAWAEWGRLLGIGFLRETILEHMHYSSNKAPMDASYETSTATFPLDLPVYEEYLAQRLHHDVETMREVLG